MASETLLWQPVVDLTTGDVLGFEALGRLVGREQDGFGPLLAWARAHGGTRPMLARMQEMTVGALDELPRGSKLFFNTRFSLLPALKGLLDQVPPQRLEDLVVELPEMDTRFAAWSSVLEPYRRQGLTLAVDDWGSGASDPLRLIGLQPEWIKLDIRLTSQIGEILEADRLVQLLVRWTNPQTTALIAEGVEHERQVLRLRELGVRYGQGFALGRPATQRPAHVAVPDGARGHLSALDARALGVLRFADVDEAALVMLSEHQSELMPLVEQAAADAAEWVADRVSGTVLRAHSDARRLREVLQVHLRALLRGSLGAEDLARMERLVATHIRLGIDWSWYVTAHREIEASLARQLWTRGLGGLGDAVRKLMAFDMALTTQMFQEALETDEFSGVFTPRVFRARMAGLLAEAGLLRRTGAVLLLEVRSRLDDGDPSARVLEHVGRVMRGAMEGRYLAGRVGDRLFGVWVPIAEDGKRLCGQLADALRREFPSVRVRAGLARHDQDGYTVDALLHIARDRLAPIHHLTVDRRPDSDSPSPVGPADGSPQVS